MTLKECYAALGGDYESVVSRLMTEKLAAKFVLKFLDDSSYENLCRALEEKNDEEAFRAAHTIKGICQNLSFTRLYESSSRLTEALRNGNNGGAAELFPQVQTDYEQTVSAIKAFQAES